MKGFTCLVSVVLLAFSWHMKTRCLPVLLSHWWRKTNWIGDDWFFNWHIAIKCFSSSLENLDDVLYAESVPRAGLSLHTNCFPKPACSCVFTVCMCAPVLCGQGSHGTLLFKVWKIGDLNWNIYWIIYRSINEALALSALTSICWVAMDKTG